MSLGVVYQRQMVYMKRDSGAVVILRDAAAPNSIPAHTHPLNQIQQSGATVGQAPVWNGSAWVPGSIAAVPGGANGQLQYNANGVFGGTTGTYEPTTGQWTFVYNDAGTNTVGLVTSFRRTSSGAPAVGIGAGFSFDVETANNNIETLATIHAEAASVAGSAERGKVVIRVMKDGVLNNTSDVIWLERANDVSTVRVVDTNGSTSRLFVGDQYGGSGILVVGTNWTSQGGSVLVHGGKGIVARSDLAIGFASTSGGTSVDQNTVYDTAIARDAAGVVKVLAAGSTLGTVRAATGSPSNPAYGNSNGDTGLFFDGGNSGAINFLCDTSTVGFIGPNALNVLAVGAQYKRFVLARTSDMEVTPNLREYITNRGATGTTTHTLNQYYTSGASGTRFTFFRVASHAIRIKGLLGTESFRRADGTLTTGGKYLEIASNGGMLEVLFDGTEWLCLYERGTINVEP